MMSQVGQAVFLRAAFLQTSALFGYLVSGFDRSTLSWHGALGESVSLGVYVYAQRNLDADIYTKVNSLWQSFSPQRVRAFLGERPIQVLVHILSAAATYSALSCASMRLNTTTAKILFLTQVFLPFPPLLHNPAPANGLALPPVEKWVIEAPQKYPLHALLIDSLSPGAPFQSTPSEALRSQLETLLSQHPSALYARVMCGKLGPHPRGWVYPEDSLRYSLVELALALKADYSLIDWLLQQERAQPAPLALSNKTPALILAHPQSEPLRQLFKDQRQLDVLLPLRRPARQLGRLPERLFALPDPL